MQVSPQVLSFHQAIQRGDLDTVQDMLHSHGFNPDAPAGMNSAMATTVDAGNVTICKALLDAGAHVNFGGRSGRFPLYIAARKGDLPMAQLLMSAGASIDMQYVTGNSSLLEAVVRAHLEMVRYLVDAGANVHLTNNAGESGLHLAAFKGSVSLMMVFLNAGVDVNLVKYEGPRKAISTGMVPLHMTAFGPHGGHRRAAEVLLSHGADVDAAMMNGRTTLHLAAMRSATGVAKVLLEHGCKVDPVSMENDEHKSPLMKAVDGGHIHMVEMLIQAGADVNFRDLWGSSPLFSAIFNGKVCIVNSLLKAGSDVNLASHGGFTPFRASLRHPPHMTQMLVHAGCNLGPESKALLDDPSDNRLSHSYPAVRAWLLSMIDNPKCLQQLCREKLRTMLGVRPSGKLAGVEMPPRLKDYILLKDCDLFLAMYGQEEGQAS